MTSTQKHTERIKRFLPEGIFVAALVLLLLMISLTTFMRLTGLPNVAEILPAEGTSAFITINTEDYLASVENPSPLITDLTNTEISGDHIAFAYIQGELVPLIEVNSKFKAKNFLETAQITDYIFLKKFLVMTPTQTVRTALESVNDGAATVESTSWHQNARGRLPYSASAQAFADLRTSRTNLVQLLGEIGYYEPGYLETILQIFSSGGVSIKMTPEAWDAELFVAVDKDQINGEAFFSHKLKYRKEFIELPSKEYAFEWGGHDLSSQLLQMSELLAILNPSASLFFDGAVQEKAKTYFGSEISLEELCLILTDEYYFGWTPGETATLILETDQETAETLKDLFAANYIFSENYSSSNGEIRATNSNLEGTSAEYNGDRYYRFGVGENTLLRLAILEDSSIMSTSEDEFFAILDKIQTGQNLTSSSDLGSLLIGADELTAINLALFPEEHILRTLLDNFDKISSSRKIFDDGVYSRYSMTLANSDD
jgi:hypothetical protein